MKTLRRVGIHGTGSYLPEKILTNHDLEKLVDTTHDWIFSRTGMAERRIAAPDQATSDLCIEASRRAIEASGVPLDEIGLVIVASVTPDYSVPCTAGRVQNALGLKNAGAFDLEAACSGFVTALSVGSSMVASGAIDHVLVIGGECMSRILDYEDRSSCILFGDGAGACLLGVDAPHGEILGTFLGADGSGGHTMVVPASGSRRPPDNAALEERLQYLHLKGNEVFKFAVSTFRDLVVRQLKEHEIEASDIGLIIPHQVNRRIIESALKKIDIDMDRVFMNLEKYGNTSGASVGIALDEAVRGGLMPGGGYTSLLAFGAGLTWASALIRW